MSYYENPQWTPGAQNNWEHQTPPPARSGASSAIPPEPAAFVHQMEEIERAIDNLMKTSGKMFGGMPGGRRVDFRMGGPGGPMPRPHSMNEFPDARGQGPPTNLQTFYASQRHQSPRGSNEAEHMMQAKRRMAAQRERELRNYHQEQQFNRNALAETSFSKQQERALSPGNNMSEGDRRDLISRQRSALYGEGPFAEAPGYIDETGTPRPGVPAPNLGGPPAALRSSGPYPADMGLASTAAGNVEAGAASSQPIDHSRADSNSSPQSNPPANRTLDAAAAAARTGNSSPDGSPSRGGAPGGSKPSAAAVAPIGTRPIGSTPAGPANPAINKARSTTPLPSPLGQSYTTAPGAEDKQNPANAGAATAVGGGPVNPASASADGPAVGGGLAGWNARPGVWGPNKPGLGVQASVWG